MGLFINCITQSETLSRDLKILVPDMNIRRRMSGIVKMGVSSGIESLLDFEPFGNVDAIITGTWIGCISDSEKFLKSISYEDYSTISPTPFINSTFNTVGAQIALLRSLHCYNNTFVNRFHSFEDGVIDAQLKINSGESQSVLVGVFDEITPTSKNILCRLKLFKWRRIGEGAVFLILTGNRFHCSVAEITDISIDSKNGDYPNEDPIFVSKCAESVWSGSSAKLLADMISENRSGLIINDLDNKFNISYRIKCLQ